MATAYLGTKFDGHDTAAFLLLPHCQEAYGLSTERITRVKHDRLFPVCAIERIAEEAKSALSSVDRICCANSFLSHRTRIYALDRYERDLENRRRISRGGSDKFSYLLQRQNTRIEFGTLHEIILLHIRKIFSNSKVSLFHFDHEYCHARSSYDFAPIDDALVLTMDGSGDNGAFSRAYRGSGGALTPVASSHSSQWLRDPRIRRPFSAPCSLGGIYAYFTHLLGFLPNSEEGKLEALAAAGRQIPSLYEAMKGAWSIGADLSLLLDAEQLESAINSYLCPDAGVGADHADLAATVQLFLEEVVVAYSRRLLENTGLKKLCLSGGVFANVLVNMKMAELVEGRMYVAPAIGDEGSAQGAASASLIADVGVGAQSEWLRDLSMPYFGTYYNRSHVLEVVDRYRSRLAEVNNFGANLAKEVARRVHVGQIGALFQGRMEFGPRALGNRSILASPRNLRFKDRINSQIKRRPPFQPVCPAVLLSEMSRLFPSAYPNPHMTCAFPLAQEHLIALPGAVHIDGTSRVQFVGPDNNKFLYDLLLEMKAISGYGVILNTSFNIHGKAIAESPEDAIEDFLDAGMDFMVMEGVLVERS